MNGPAPNFDRVARVYQLMEYLSFGPMLERCRFFHLPRLKQSRRALILGDGDGRFLAQLLGANPAVHAVAVDASPAMLRLLAARAARIDARHRIFTIAADARAFTPSGYGYDLIASHFFLDCLAPDEAAQLIARLRPHLALGSLWLISEFHIPTTGRLTAALARSIVSALYAAFRLLTGLEVRQIPPWQALLAKAGFTRKASRAWLRGLLVSELWEYAQATASHPRHSHEGMSDSALHFGSIPGIDPGPMPAPDPPPVPEPEPAPGPAPDPDPEPYPGPIPAPQPVT